MNKLEDFFWNKPKQFKVHKWHHYFEIYDRHFSRYIDKSPTILEVGVQRGGSLEMWNYYFGKGCKIYGVDIDPRCKRVETDIPNSKIFIGNQESPLFWDEVKKSVPKVDILIDDGGHRMNQQIVTFECMYEHIKDDGVYLCEDLHTSYWSRKRYGGGLKKEGTFIEYSKDLIDKINAHHNHLDLDFRKKTNSIHYYDSILVLEKRIDGDKPVASIR